MNALSTIERPQIATGDLIAAAIERGITQEGVGVIEKLMELQERQEKRHAEREFAADFAKLQAKMPAVLANKAVPNKGGGVKYMYAPYEEIMGKARGALTECNFAITFDTDFKGEGKEARVVVTCTLLHTGGHSRSNTHAARVGSGPLHASEAQADGAATTYAKRFALCAALNIVIEQDNDGARNEGSGEMISKEQAEDFRARCLSTNTDMLKFCKWLAGPDATSFDEIPAKRWADGDAQLKKREAGK